jgi:hypothetical protein
MVCCRSLCNTDVEGFRIYRYTRQDDRALDNLLRLHGKTALRLKYLGKADKNENVGFAGILTAIRFGRQWQNLSTRDRFFRQIFFC